MSLFQKVGHTFGKLFSESNAPTLFRKVSNTARKADNSIQRIGGFLANTAGALGQHAIANGIKSGLGVVHNIRGSLQKAIHAPLGDIKKENTTYA
jgi:hypothetical protein